MASAPPPVGAAAAGIAPYERHPLGLPRGSVRALLASIVFGLIWALLVVPEETPAHVPLYLYYLMFLILGHYFAHRSQAPPAAPGTRHWHPLFLPRGTLRFVFLVGFFAALGWGFYHDPHFLDRLTPSAASVAEAPYLLPLILGAFLLGVLVGRVGDTLLRGPTGVAPWFQDLQAWLALIAVLGLGVEVIIHLVINPTLGDRPLKLPNWESFLAAVVAFYFGARS
jgi:hypothetical protein